MSGLSEHWAEATREIRNAGDAFERASRAVLRAAADDSRLGSFQEGSEVTIRGATPHLQQAAKFADRLATEAHEWQTAAAFGFGEDAS